MTLTKQKKRILLIALPAAVVFIAVLLCLLLLQPWIPSRDRQKIDRLSDYGGLLDFPITEITLCSPLHNPYYEVAFSDEDLIQIWNDYLGRLEVQLEDRDYYSYHITGGTPNQSVIVKTTQGEYVLWFSSGKYEIDRSSGEETLEYQQWEDGNYRLKYDGWYYTLSDPENFPFDQTYEIAAQRHGETGPG